jgi:hypothetical protein
MRSKEIAHWNSLQKSFGWHKNIWAKSPAAYCQTIYWEKYLVNSALENNKAINHFISGHFFFCF